MKGRDNVLYIFKSPKLPAQHPVYTRHPFPCLLNKHS